jgi:predicted DCC family thiol-disulfide oxidoreductase YuxK
MEPVKSLTVYYDGACPVCSREIGVYRGCAGAERIAWVDVGAPDAAEKIADDLARDRALARFHVRAADGTLVSGAAAFAALWCALPAWHWLGRMASLPPITRLLELLYRGFLALRRRRG